MDPTPPSSQLVNYGTTRTSWRRIVWRILRPTILVLAPLIIYSGIYLVVSQRSYSWGGGFAVQYPGLVRFYALSPKMSASLGQSEELIERHTDAGGTVGQFDDSLMLVSPGWWHHLWRAFYAAERVELVLRGHPPLRIAYSSPAPIIASPATPSTLPFVGPVYQDWFVRNGTLYRFIQAVFAARDRSNTLTRRNDVYLFEWPLDGPWEDKPRAASGVRLVESNSRTAWEPHWMVDADHFITWNENTGETRLLTYGANGQPATTAATIRGLRPVRCNRVSPISVSPTAR